MSVTEQKQNRSAQEGPIRSGKRHLNLWNQFVDRFRYLDRTLIILVFALIITSTIMIFTANLAGDPFGEIIKQGLAVFGGWILFLIVMAVPYKFFQKLWLYIIVMVFVIGLLFATLGQAERGGATSWLTLGPLSFQPSELVKILTILIIARIMDELQADNLLHLFRNPGKIRWAAIFLLLLAFVIIFAQPDLGMLLIIVSVVILMVVLAKPKRQNITILLFVTLFIYLGIYLWGKVQASYLANSGFSFFERVAAFVDPYAYPQSVGYQLIQSYNAFARGGLFGLGLGQSMAKYGALPALATDFIIAHIGEELGLLGVLFFLSIIMALTYVLYERAYQSRDFFRRRAILGIASALFVQALANLGGAVGILPLTGVTLPFVSYGGSSMLVSLLMIAIVLRFEVEDAQEPRIDLVYNKQEKRKVSDGIN